jgi:hypothetical protein
MLTAFNLSFSLSLYERERERERERREWQNAVPSIINTREESHGSVVGEVGYRPYCRVPVTVVGPDSPVEL